MNTFRLSLGLRGNVGEQDALWVWLAGPSVTNDEDDEDVVSLAGRHKLTLTLTMAITGMGGFLAVRFRPVPQVRAGYVGERATLLAAVLFWLRTFFLSPWGHERADTISHKMYFGMGKAQA